MKLEPECIGCFFNQIMKSLRLNEAISTEKIISTQTKFMEYLLSLEIEKVEAPIIATRAYELIAEMHGCLDPYKSIKLQTNNLSLRYYDQIKKAVLSSKDPLFQAIIISALANSIDYASQHQIELVSDLKEFDQERLIINHYEKFISSVRKANTILIIGDNAGEIVFDKLLIEILIERYPNLETIYAVRSAPIINDATLADAKLIGLDKLIKVITSGPTPGVNFQTATADFKKFFFMKNTVILSKGQGNFESLYGLDLPDQDLYYLFMAKCNLMERILGAKIGQLIFMKKTAKF